MITRSNVPLSETLLSSQQARKFLAEFVELKRREGHAKQAAVDVEKPENVLAFHPEMVLVYLLHLLAHHPDFPGEEEAEDASAYEIFQK
jgi:sister-chromatid-cohesion protein PDS5